MYALRFIGLVNWFVFISVNIIYTFFFELVKVTLSRFQERRGKQASRQVLIRALFITAKSFRVLITYNKQH